MHKPSAICFLLALWVIKVSQGFFLGAQEDVSRLLTDPGTTIQSSPEANRLLCKRDFRLFLTKTEHFRIYYLAFSADAALEVLDYAKRYYQQISEKFEIQPKRIRIFLQSFPNEQCGFTGSAPPNIQVILYSSGNTENQGYNWREQLEANFAYQLGRYLLITYDKSRNRTLVNALNKALGLDLVPSNFLMLPLWIYTAFGYAPYIRADTATLPGKQNQQRVAIETLYLRDLLPNALSFDYYASFSENMQNAAVRRANNAIVFLRYILQNPDTTATEKAGQHPTPIVWILQDIAANALARPGAAMVPSI